MAIALEPFDPSRDFVAQNSFRAGGRIHLRKHPFDKSCVNERVLGQLYEARQIAYAPGEPAPAPVGTTEPDTPEEQHEALVAQQQEQNTEEASGTAREAPGAAESTAAESGEASASTDETAESVANDAAPLESEAAAAPEGDAETAAAEPGKPQLDHDHNGAAGGSEPDTGGTAEEQNKRLCGRWTRAQLLSIADGLELPADATKPVIAEAIVKAGRADNEPA